MGEENNQIVAGGRSKITLKIWLAITSVGLCIIGALIFLSLNFFSSHNIANDGITESELKVVDGAPKILIDGEDKITFINHIYYVGSYEHPSGVSLDDYGRGVWLTGVKKQIDEMNKYGANTLFLDIFWSDLVTAENEPSDVEKSINFAPLDEAMAYAKEKNIYMIINPKIDVFLAWWWQKKNNFPFAESFSSPGVNVRPCIPQEKDSNYACIPKEICVIGDSRCCAELKEQLYCCNLDMPDPKAGQTIVSGVSVGLAPNGLVKCKAWDNNSAYSKCTECETDSYGWKYNNPGMSAEIFRKDYSDYLTVLVNRYKNNSSLIGWGFSLGASGEDQYGPSYIVLRSVYGSMMGESKIDQIADYSDDAQKKFKIWIKNKYATDIKLQDSWGDKSLSLETIKLPDPKKVFKVGKEGPFPDGWFTGFFTSLDNLTTRGKDLYEFRGHIRDVQRGAFTKLIKGLDNKHIIVYFGVNEEGIYNDPNIDALIGANHIEYAVNGNNEINFITMISALNKKRGKASIFALESAGETGGMEGKSVDKEKQKEALLNAWKAMKCMGSYLGYVSSFGADMPKWTSSDLKVLREIRSYSVTKNCICDFVKPSSSVAIKKVSDIVKIFGLEDYYNCLGNGNLNKQEISSDKNTIPSGQGKCGDGVCDDFEKANNVCFQDCG